MDLFKSVFAHEPDLPIPGPRSGSNSKSDSDPDTPPPQHQQNLNDDAEGGAIWSFGGLFKTLTIKSESVIETYRRDLKEFGSGLRKEIEVAQGSLGTVGHAIDEIGTSVVKGTAQMISQGKEALLAASPENPESDYSSDNNSNLDRNHRSLSSNRYSRFDAEVRAVQGDPNTYTEEPEDKEDYEKWKSGFGGLDGKTEEMGRLLDENVDMGAIYGRLVPGSVDEDGFWFRYYYKVYKLRQTEDMRANIVRRAILKDEEELSWDVDDEDEEELEVAMGKEKGGVEGNVDLGREGSAEIVKDGDVKKVSSEESERVVKKVEGGKNEVNADEVNERSSAEESKVEKVVGSSESVPSKEVVVEESKGEDVVKGDEKVGAGESSKVAEVLVVSKDTPLQEEEDLGWDEIEDLSSIDEKRVSHSGSPNKVDLQKRLSTAEEEDLSWDIEDDD